jgi:hypothetical protein
MSLNNINRLMSVKGKRHVFCEVRTEFLNIYMGLDFEGLMNACAETW